MLHQQVPPLHAPVRHLAHLRGEGEKGARRGRAVGARLECGREPVAAVRFLLHVLLCTEAAFLAALGMALAPSLRRSTTLTTKTAAVAQPRVQRPRRTHLAAVVLLPALGVVLPVQTSGRGRRGEVDEAVPWGGVGWVGWVGWWGWWVVVGTRLATGSSRPSW